MTVSNRIGFNKRILQLVFIAELFLCSGEGLLNLKSNISHQESWPWFYSFTLNMPASNLVAVFFSYMVSGFGIQSWAGQKVLAWFLFLVGGTIWWTLVFHILYGMCGSMRRRPG